MTTNADREKQVNPGVHEIPFVSRVPLSSVILSSQVTYVFIALIAVAAGMSISSSAFLTPYNLSNIAMNFSFTAIASIGMTFVILSGGIDLSVGSVMALSAISAAWTTNVLASTSLGSIPGASFVIATSAGMLAAALVGFINGFLIARIGLSPFITTLGMLSVVRGACYFATGGQTTLIGGIDGDLINNVLAGRVAGVPTPLLYLIGILIWAVIALWHTAWGRYAAAIGGNEKAAEVTGVPVIRVKVSIYVVAGMLSGFSGIVVSSWLGSAPANLAVGDELNVIAAVVIGGANLIGGSGNPIGSILGSILIEIIRNGLVLAQVNTYAQSMFVGLIIIAAVLIDRIRTWRASH